MARGYNFFGDGASASHGAVPGVTSKNRPANQGWREGTGTKKIFGFAEISV
jgi:hypothetical protein